MNRSQRWLAAALVAAVVLGCLWQWVPLADAQGRVAALPARGIGYDSADLPVDPAEASIFGEARVIKRLYRVGADRFSLIVIDGTRNRHAVHDPMLCVRGGGWDVGARERLQVPGGEGELVTIAKGGVSSQVLYWFSDGESRHASSTSYWLQTTCRRLTFGATGDEPVLVLVQSQPGEAVDWRRLVNERFLPLTAF